MRHLNIKKSWISKVSLPEVTFKRQEGGGMASLVQTLRILVLGLAGVWGTICWITTYKQESGYWRVPAKVPYAGAAKPQKILDFCTAWKISGDCRVEVVYPTSKEYKKAVKDLNGTFFPQKISIIQNWYYAKIMLIFFNISLKNFSKWRLFHHGMCSWLVRSYAWISNTWKSTTQYVPEFWEWIAEHIWKHWHLIFMDESYHWEIL